MSPKILVPLAALASLLPAQSRQQPSQSDLKVLREEKLAKPVFQRAPWLTDYDQARATAKQQKKLLFTYFTRSYAHCGPCDALEDGPFSEPEFAKFAASVVLFVHNTSRVDDEPYPKLLEEKGFRAFPSICFMDADGAVLSKPARSVARFVEVHESTVRLVALRAQSEPSCATVQKELFLVELKLDLIPADKIQSRAEQVQLTDADRVFVAQKMVDAEIAAIQAKAGKDGPEKTGEAFAALLAAGKTPSDGIGSSFWVVVLHHASKQKDAALAQRAYDELVRRHGKEKQYERACAAWKQLLDDANAK